MRVAMKIMGWVLLGVGILATVSNSAQMITGVPGRFGPLAFSVVLIVTGLLLVSLVKNSTDTKGDGQAGLTPEQGCCPLCGKIKHMNKSRSMYGVPVCRSCSNAFANLRLLAVVIDELVLVGLFLATTKGGTSSITDPVAAWLSVIYFIKDGFWGYSPGKALLGLQVINENTGKPIGFLRSIKRNLPILFPIMPLIIGSQVHKGHRSGDLWSQSKVVWKRYSAHPIFQSKASKDYIWTQEIIDLDAGNALTMAMKAERNQLWNKAAGLYQKIVMQYPSALVAEDAKVALELLKKRLSEQGISITCENEVEKSVPCSTKALLAGRPLTLELWKKVIILLLGGSLCLLSTLILFANLPHYAQDYGYLSEKCFIYYTAFLGGCVVFIGSLGYRVAKRTFSLRAMGTGSCLYLIGALISIGRGGLKDDFYPVLLVFAALTVAMMVSIVFDKYKLRNKILDKHA
jgi:uncharacterized RDD family membrane protein YckC